MKRRMRVLLCYYLAAFVGRPDEIRRLLQSSQPPQRVTLMGAILHILRSERL